MISLSHLNKLIFFTIFFIILIFKPVFGEDEPVDIWKNKKKQNEQDSKSINEKDIEIESPIISGDVEKIIIKIEDSKIKDQSRSVIGIFDPDENNFNLNMWLDSDGKEIRAGINQLVSVYQNLSAEDLTKFYSSIDELIGVNSFTFDDSNIRDSAGTATPDFSLATETMDNEMFTRYLSDSSI